MDEAVEDLARQLVFYHSGVSTNGNYINTSGSEANVN